MKTRFAILLIALALGACATNERRQQETQAIDDFIVANELEDTRRISLHPMETYRHETLGDYHALVSTRRGDYLVTFFMRCVEFSPAAPPPDVRRNANEVVAGEDTIRGCRIEAIYPIDAGQRDELRQIVDGAPGGN